MGSAYALHTKRQHTILKLYALLAFLRASTYSHTREPFKGGRAPLRQGEQCTRSKCKPPRTPACRAATHVQKAPSSHLHTLPLVLYIPWSNYKAGARLCGSLEQRHHRQHVAAERCAHERAHASNVSCVHLGMSRAGLLLGYRYTTRVGTRTCVSLEWESSGDTKIPTL
eukprot:6176432-Pleurochrysis_carterae.AAC.1